MTREPGGDSPAGLGLAFVVYFVWGLFPLYFSLLPDLGPVQVVAHRILWSLVVCLVLVALLGGRLGAASLRRVSRRQLAGLAAAAALLTVNWGVFIYAVDDGQVVQSSLGYFINPLVNVVLGVALLGERLRVGQWVAVAVAAAAVVVLTVEDGRLPWIALALAGSFAGYGLIKNRVGRGLAALPGMTIETAVLVVPALGLLIALQAHGEPAFGASVPQALLLAGTGPLTAGTLLVFAAAARRIRLSTLGLMQYVVPVMHLLIGLLVLGESMTAGRWIGFALIWVALAVLSLESLRRLARGRAGERRAEPSEVAVV